MPAPRMSAGHRPEPRQGPDRTRRWSGGAAHRSWAMAVPGGRDAGYFQFFRKAPTVMLLIEAESGRIVDANEAAADFYGYGLDRLLAMGIDQINTLPMDRCRRERMRAVQGETNRFLFSHRLASGLTRYVDVHSTPILEHGLVYLLSTVQDVTQLHQAEEANLRIMKAIEQCPVSIVLTDLTGRIDYVNPRFEEVTGYTAAEALGQNPRILKSGLHPESFYRDLWSVILAGGVWQGEIRNRAKSGEPFWEKAIIAPVRDPEGQISSFVAVKEDITERRREEAEHHRLEAQVLNAQKLESLGTLAGGIAHDMNNVLGAILALASAQVESPAGPESSARAFRTIVQAANRGRNVVRGLLQFARQTPAEERKLDLNPIIRDQVLLLERTTLARVRLALDLQPDLRPVRGDGSALAHALMNLCVNAVDAMPANGTLALRSRNAGPDRVELVVENDGCGMEPEVLAQACNPFFTTKPPGQGTGLGLFMVFNTIKTHRGQIDIQSTRGRGTRVTLVLPACKPDEGTTRPAPAPDRNLPNPSLKILLVDDDELIQESVQELLQAMGHEATVAGCGEEALALLEAGCQADAVILDMNMPGLGGAGTLPRLRAHWPDLPVLLTTGRADQAVLDLVEADRNLHLLAKPFTFKEMQELLSRTTPS